MQRCDQLNHIKTLNSSEYWENEYLRVSGALPSAIGNPRDY